MWAMHMSHAVIADGMDDGDETVVVDNVGDEDEPVIADDGDELVVANDTTGGENALILRILHT